MNFVKRSFRPLSLPAGASAALLVMRLIMGIAFLFHGWGKIQSPFSWMPAQGDSSVPGLLQAAAALAEFGGGVALILGFLTPVVGVGLGITMVVATAVHAVVLGDPFVASGPGGGSFEPALGYLGLCLVFLFVGPGRFSLDAKLFGERG